MIHANQLSKIYRRGAKSVSAFDHVSFDAEAGECISLLGRSGSGKSTLLNLLAGLDRPSSGDLNVAGLELSQCKKNEVDQFRRESVGVVFQQFQLINHRTAFENIEFPLIIAGVERRKRRDRVSECLDLVGLTKRAKHKPSELSGGEQQRVAVARAISNHPAILLADEPTGNLDSENANQIMELICEIQRHSKSTLILVTHDEELATTFTSRILRLADGKIISDEENRFTRSKEAIR